MQNPMQNPMSTAIIFFCHGARAHTWRLPFEQIVEQFRARMPDRQVRLAFLELMSPGLAQVIDELAGEGARAIRVVPLFLAPGSHTREDLPALLQAARQRWPQLHLESATTLTESPLIRDAIVQWAVAADQATTLAVPTETVK